MGEPGEHGKGRGLAQGGDDDDADRPSHQASGGVLQRCQVAGRRSRTAGAWKKERLAGREREEIPVRPCEPPKPSNGAPGDPSLVACQVFLTLESSPSSCLGIGSVAPPFLSPPSPHRAAPSLQPRPRQRDTTTMAANAQDSHAPLRPEGKKDEDKDEESTYNLRLLCTLLLVCLGGCRLRFWGGFVVGGGGCCYYASGGGGTLAALRVVRASRRLLCSL